MAIRRRRRTGRRTVRQVAVKGQPRVRRAIVVAIEATKAATSETAIRAALDRGDLGSAVNAVPWRELGEPLLRADFGRAFRSIFETAGEATADQVGAIFAVVDPGARDFLAEHGGQFIREFGGMTPQELRTRLVEMSNEGLSVREAAKRFKDAIGLTTRQQAALETFREKLLESGLTAGRLEKAVARKAAALLRLRAETIARTEAQFAATAGQQDAWRQAAAQGLFDPNVAEREWVTSSAPCPICDPLDGVRVRLDEPWVLADGTTVNGPPEPHPNCLCTVVLHANAARAAA